MTERCDKRDLQEAMDGLGCCWCARSDKSGPYAYWIISTLARTKAKCKKRLKKWHLKTKAKSKAMGLKARPLYSYPVERVALVAVYWWQTTTNLPGPGAGG